MITFLKIFTVLALVTGLAIVLMLAGLFFYVCYRLFADDSDSIQP